MRLNESTCLVSPSGRLALVPYRREHVETYHEWMQRPELLEATASEPLTFEQELEMQQKWHLDDDKLTFILLASPGGDEARRAGSSSTHTTWSAAQIHAEGTVMIGDVNLFLPEGPQGEDVECEIMLAEEAYRGRGLGREALSMLSLMVRIGTSNASSIKLFERLGFGAVSVSEVWKEVEMRFGWRGGQQLDEREMSELARERWTARGIEIDYPLDSV